MAISSISELNNVAGSNTQIQYNNSGVFGASSNLTFNGTDELQLTDNTKLTLGTGNDADIYYDGTNLVIEPQVVGSGAVVINDAANMFLNDTANANTTVGLTINQGANDDEIISLKSSDVAHGMTALTETDSYGFLKKIAPTTGGLFIRGFQEGGNNALYLAGVGTGTADNSASTSAGAVITMDAAEKSGTGAGAQSANANSMRVANNGTNCLIVDAEGDLSVNGSSTLGTFDEHVDYQLVRSARMAIQPELLMDMPHMRKMVEDHGDVLEANGIIHRNRDTDGVPFVSLKNGLFLAWDGIYQTGKKVYEEIEPKLRELQDELNKRDERIALLESRLNLLET